MGARAIDAPGQIMTARAIATTGFALVIGAMLTLEVIGRRRTSRVPTVSEWLGYLMRARAGRALILLGWWWLGWHYFARLAATRRPVMRCGGPLG